MNSYMPFTHITQMLRFTMVTFYFLRYKSHTIKFIILKCIISGLYIIHKTMELSALFNSLPSKEAIASLYPLASAPLWPIAPLLSSGYNSIDTGGFLIWHMKMPRISA